MILIQSVKESDSDLLPCFFVVSYSVQGKPPHIDPSNGPKPGGSGGSVPDQTHSPRKSPHGDTGGPKSPYSLPQIAPMPSSKLCPVCKTADLTGMMDGQPNCNTCTQCRTTVCNQCGFNPNPHLTEVRIQELQPNSVCTSCLNVTVISSQLTLKRSGSAPHGFVLTPAPADLEYIQ